MITVDDCGMGRRVVLRKKLFLIITKLFSQSASSGKKSSYYHKVKWVIHGLCGKNSMLVKPFGMKKNSDRRLHSQFSHSNFLHLCFLWTRSLSAVSFLLWIFHLKSRFVSSHFFHYFFVQTIVILLNHWNTTCHCYSFSVKACGTNLQNLFIFPKVQAIFFHNFSTIYTILLYLSADSCVQLINEQSISLSFSNDSQLVLNNLYLKTLALNKHSSPNTFSHIANVSVAFFFSFIPNLIVEFYSFYLENLD